MFHFYDYSCVHTCFISIKSFFSSFLQFPSELDPWKVLQEHILSDYLNHEGHELTIRVLYRLYGEAEGEQDFFSSNTAASAYESFLLTVVHIWAKRKRCSSHRWCL